jgi:GT2 family glycosyltransferase/glycosyltransferase involved in cell wall biosynthesis/SAM-dependent methyltransferase/Flp pilus assembly protein TadD
MAPRATALLLQLEFPTWATARPWTYSANFAVQEGLTAAGIECVTVPVIAETPCSSPDSWVFHARRLFANRTFDQVWVWLVHTRLDADTLAWIAGLAPVRVGILMESLSYDAEDYTWAPHLQLRRAHVEQQMRYMTHVLAPDELDADDLNQRNLAKTLWWPPMALERFITVPPAAPIHRHAVFHGTPYGPRRSWVADSMLKDRLAYQKAGPPTQYHQLFDQLQQHAAACVRQGAASDALMQQYVRTLHKIRLGEFREWMTGLQQWPAIVNLPSLAKFYGGRVFEGMAAGRPVISWTIRNHPRNLTLFEEEKEILLFPADDPDALARQIRRIQQDASFSQTLARNAQQKVREFHTSERRLRDTLHWIETGVEPSYGLAPQPAHALSVPDVEGQEPKPCLDLTLNGATEPNIDSISHDIKTTVFILTIGDEVFASCKKAIEAQQSCRFALDVIQNVAPFSAAAQEMISRCRTPYFIQVDEDMILTPDAVATMEAAMDAAPEDVGMICFHLYDDDRELTIQGVKIYRTALIKGLSFRDLKASEMDLLEQMGREGIRWILHPEVKGRHGTHYTVESMYRRYKTMYEKDIRQWNLLPSDIRKKADRFRETGDPLQLFALLGAAHGIIHAPHAADREKDARLYDLPELKVFKRLFTSAPPEIQFYDPAKSGTPVKHQPIPFDQVQWKRSDESMRPVSPANDGSTPRGVAPASPMNHAPEQSRHPRILLATPLFWPSIGGVETIGENLSVELLKHGYEVDVATLELPQRLGHCHRGMTVISLSTKRTNDGVPLYAMQLYELVVSGEYRACIIIANPIDIFIYALANAQIPPQTRLLIQPVINKEAYDAFVPNPVAKRHLGNVLRSASAAISLTRTGLDDRFMREEDVEPAYLPNAVELLSASGDFRKEYGIPDDAFVILHVANLWEVKNHLGLLHELRNLPAGMRLVMIGQATTDAAYSTTVLRELEKRSDVFYIPGLSPENVASAMQAADVVVLSSHAEASPVCILEAMSHRKPWLATPECGAVVEHAGGIVTPLSGFVPTLKRLQERPDLREELASAGHEHWQASYRWAVTIQGWVDLIETGCLQRSFDMPNQLAQRMDHLRSRIAAAVGEPTRDRAGPALQIDTPQPPRPIQNGVTPMPFPSEPLRPLSPAHRDGQTDEFYTNLFVKSSHWSTPHPNADESARWSKIAAFLEYILRRVRQQDPTRRLRMLDVGCGRGWLTNLATMYGTCEGIEPVAGVIDHARKLFPHLRFEAGTAESVLQRPDFTPYDVVLTSEVIEHVPHGQKETFIAQLAKLLKPDGYVILTTPRGEMWEQWKTIAPPNQPVEDWVTEEQLRGLFTSQGFGELGLERVHVEIPTLRYIPAPTPADLKTLKLVPIYQVWACQPAVGAAVPSFTRPPMVSVIVPTYNRPDRLREALASVLAQTYQDFEIIVVNDGTSDVDSVITALNTGGRLTCIKHDRNRGLAAARNTGLRAAKGKYVAYLDDDDRYLPGHLETLVTFLEHNDRKAAYTDAWRVCEKFENGRHIEAARDLPYSHDFNPADLLISNYFPVLCVMHERSCLEEVGFFDESLFAHEDWDLWIRMATKYPFGHIKQTTAEFTWRTDGSSMTSSACDTYYRTTEIIYRKYQPYARQSQEILKAQQQRLDQMRKELQPQAYDCSIVIPVSNKMELTVQCLTALAKLTEQLRYEVIIIDNGSSDGTGDFLQQLGGDVRVITNSRNLGFAKACNQGARVARGTYVVFLNNDTIPLQGWLGALVAEVEMHPEVGIVGGKLLYPDGTVQHAGVVLDRTHLSPYHIYKSFPGDHPAVNQRREFQIVTGACLLIRRSLFQEVGGFDEAFVNGFEDVDLCLKIREKGHVVVYQPRSVLYHLESQTSGRKSHEEENAKALHERWGTHWWAADEDFYFYTDGYKLIGTDRGGAYGADLLSLADIKDRAAWAHVAATQAAAIKKDWGAVRQELNLVDHWPADPYVLSWAATICERLAEPVLHQSFLLRYLELADAPAERLALVRTLLAQKDLAAADQHLTKLLAACPTQAEGLLLNGILCMQREQYREAETAFSSALRQGADRKKCLMGMGMASLGRAYAQGAWERFLQVLAENPDDAEAIHWLLRAGTAQNRWAELGRQLHNYLSRNPGDLAARFALSGVLVRADQIDAARREHDALRALAPTYDGLAELGQAIAGKEAVLAMETTHS